ncbi:MAG: SpoIIE family protein phosphatase [Cellulomonas sp.]|uniref:Serine/threonine phosphatase n=1 Tax=Cellulomonas gelida TaxID=1712 RepID=A0A4Y3KHU4_9CELL|nr:MULTISPECIES: SpoIIE family protein phosphatase [Cellulomonas]MCR6647119.1 SpoIIE family protein phosphatase [Cellulomonas sp.]MCR6706030.1 SpoIIE family protein phosphatase [Cellulomonas sp.]GEA83979.1 serine/threonine phosphatase [Cellulomonas gelida]GGL27667.1 serine/threonine phosphatase [Cellulomonas gelida]
MIDVDDARRAPGPDVPATLRLLVVEDDEGDWMLASEHLADSGLDARLTWARTLDEAALMLDVDCVLLDLGLPDASGLPALRRLLAAGAPPVIVLTGLADSTTGLAAVAAGAQDYLVKSDVDGERLARSVRYAIARRQLEHADRALYRSLVREQETTRLEQALLPRPAVNDRALELLVGYRAGRDGVLGGDFYDAVERLDGTVLAIVGDVCGHGPDEAALGATLRTAWRTLVLAGVPTDDLFGLLERVLEAERPRAEIFTTVAMVAVAPDRRSADLYLAGHPVPLVLGTPTTLASAARRGRALGIPVPGGWTPLHLDLPASWRLLLYTDGLMEATLADSTERIGKPGLLAVVDESLAAEALDPGGPDVVERVIEGVRTLHGGDLVDDAAVVVVGWRA